MKTRSAKAKGQRLASEVKEALLKWYPDLCEADIWVTPSGVNGPDLGFSRAACEAIGLVIETKNQEALNVWAALEQAESHKGWAGMDLTPALIFRRNRTPAYIAMRFEDYLKHTGVVNVQAVSKHFHEQVQNKIEQGVQNLTYLIHAKPEGEQS